MGLIKNQVLFSQNGQSFQVKQQERVTRKLKYKVIFGSEKY